MATWNGVASELNGGADVGITDNLFEDINHFMWDDFDKCFVEDFNNLSCTLGGQTPTNDCLDNSDNQVFSSDDITTDSSGTCPEEPSLKKTRRKLQFGSDSEEIKSANGKIPVRSPPPVNYVSQCSKWEGHQAVKHKGNVLVFDQQGLHQIDQTSGIFSDVNLKRRNADDTFISRSCRPHIDNSDFGDAAGATNSIATRKFGNFKVSIGNMPSPGATHQLTTYVAQPFTLGYRSTALEDINQRILSRKDEARSSDDSQLQYSAFSGKPVIGKTKIRTEGGRGSITIVRTKG